MSTLTPSPVRPARRWLRGIAWLAGALLGLAVLAVAGIALRQERLLFHPEPLPAGFDFAAILPPGQTFETIPVRVPGATLSAILLRQQSSRGLVFYLHGNSGNLATWLGNAAFYRALGYDLFLLDYRGFGQSSGVIDGEAQLHDDVRAAWQRVAPAYAGRPIVVIGRSLGSGLAVQLAHDVRPDLLVLVTPYASLSRLAAEHMPYVPSALLRYPLASDRIIGDVRSPVLIFHGDRDEVIDVAHAHSLLALAAADAELVEVAGASHTDIQTFAAYRDRLAVRLRALGGP